ncbi:MAG: DUF6797 domain-containing protein [Verrucomicrobiota bacterium]
MKLYLLFSTLCLAALFPLISRGDALSATNEVTRGPFHSATVRAPKNSGTIAMKGIVVTVGPQKNAYVCYDADLLRVSMAWTGGFLEFGDTLNKIAWPPPPQVKGTPAFGVNSGPGWAKGGSFADPRVNQQGPLPKTWAHYKGLYQNGDQVVLSYSVGDAEVLETPGFESKGDVFTRTIQFTKVAKNQSLVLADGVENTKLQLDFSKTGEPAIVSLVGVKKLVVSGAGLPEGARLETTDEGRLILKFPKIPANKPFQLWFANEASPDTFAALRGKSLTDLRRLTKGGTANWTENAITKGIRSTANEPYVVDTITEPIDNPWNAKTFFGGFDFFPDGRAAICTFHGDVFIVSGIDESLEKITWKRFATGLFQPLGVKVVKGNIYVLGRDQITRLQDLNGDGEADFYENFNNDTVVTANYHEFCLDLHTDRAGNFYFAKGAPWEPEVTSPHQGCLLKVSKDGSKLEIIATGFRAPNGMTVGPHDEITVSDNQGHWMPSSKVSWIKKGGFYGMTPSAQRPLTLQRDGTNFIANPSDPKDRSQFKFKGWEATSPAPTSYDQPLAWLPQNMDNSSGGQLWVTSKKWGPLNDRLLFMSYGKCTLFEVMPEIVNGTRQAAMFQLPLKFNSGLMRGRINPRDGQVYLSGLRGWQTSATKDGGFYRVRYTGAPVRMPTAFHAAKNGVQISFTTPLDPKTAADPASYSVERWNYHWSGAYGSPEFSVNNPTEKKHDTLEVKTARLLPDHKSVWLQIDDLRPADQMKIKFSFDTADGASMSQEIYGTIHQMGAVKN